MTCNCFDQLKEHLNEEDKTYQCTSTESAMNFSLGEVFHYPFTLEFRTQESNFSKRSRKVIFPTFCCVCGKRIKELEAENDVSSNN